MKGREERRSNGIVYVTGAEFARRMEVSDRAIRNAMSSGMLTVKVFKGDSTRYVPLEESTRIWEQRRRPRNRTRGERRVEEEQGGYPSLAGFSVATTEVEKVAADEVAVHEVGTISDETGIKGINSIDPRAFSDCWLYDRSGNPVLNRETGEHVFNWDLVGKKLKALIYNQQLEEKRGQLVEKEEVTRILSSIFQPLVSSIGQIPNMHASMIVATVSDNLGTPLDEEVRSAIQNVMHRTTERILRDFKDAIRKVLEEEDG